MTGVERSVRAFRLVVSGLTKPTFTLANMKYSLIARTCLPDTVVQTVKGAWVSPAVLDLYLTFLTICKAFDFTVKSTGPILPLRVSPSKMADIVRLTVLLCDSIEFSWWTGWRIL